MTAGQLCDCGSGKLATDCCYKPEPEPEPDE